MLTLQNSGKTSVDVHEGVKISFVNIWLSSWDTFLTAYQWLFILMKTLLLQIRELLQCHLGRLSHVSYVSALSSASGWSPANHTKRKAPTTWDHNVILKAAGPQIGIFHETFVAPKKVFFFVSAAIKKKHVLESCSCIFWTAIPGERQTRDTSKARHNQDFQNRVKELSPREHKQRTILGYRHSMVRLEDWVICHLKSSLSLVTHATTSS